MENIRRSYIIIHVRKKTSCDTSKYSTTKSLTQGFQSRAMAFSVLNFRQWFLFNGKYYYDQGKKTRYVQVMYFPSLYECVYYIWVNYVPDARDFALSRWFADVLTRWLVLRTLEPAVPAPPGQPLSRRHGDASHFHSCIFQWPKYSHRINQQRSQDNSKHNLNTIGMTSCSETQTNYSQQGSQKSNLTVTLSISRFDLAIFLSISAISDLRLASSCLSWSS